ncbi:hypothetical protein [Campylobacter ureolyticus]|uniref:hypothetical protein n=1 Tax=Campylobacter ureolyticus TaxID=827 RepID=UPI001650B344|nr:hypothetical protein [Campylobacter ureolyticus]
MIFLLLSLAFLFTGCVAKTNTLNNETSDWNFLFDSEEFVPINKNQNISKKAM